MVIALAAGAGAAVVGRTMRTRQETAAMEAHVVVHQEVAVVVRQLAVIPAPPAAAASMSGSSEDRV